MYGQNFPAENVDVLLNKIVQPKVLDKSISAFAYKNFYSKFDTVSKKLIKFKKSHRAFPISVIKSDYNTLVGKEFKVVNIYKQQTILGSREDRFYVLELEGDKLGTVFYSYDAKHEFDFELVVVGGL